MGILCLSAKWDNILMWSHYTKEHQGFVIEFDAAHEFFGKTVFKVNYSKERPLLGDRADGWNRGGLFETKSKDWEYEEEYRKFQYFGKESPLPDGNTFVEFPEPEEIDATNWPLRLIDVPPESIRKVILGYRASDDTKRRIRSALKGAGLKHVICAQVQPHRTEYRMEEIKTG